MPETVYASQNRNIWSGIRAMLGLQPAPVAAPSLDPTLSIVPVLEVGAGGFANQQVYTFSRTNSINGAAFTYTVSTGTPTTFNGIAPTIRQVKKVESAQWTLTGGAVTPIAITIIAIDQGGVGFNLETTYLANPGVYDLVRPRYIPQDFDIQLYAAAGGVGDNVNISAQIMVAEPGEEIIRV